jgi:hypothetical protein
MSSLSDCFNYAVPGFGNRFIKHAELEQEILKLKAAGNFEVAVLGHSVQQRTIYRLTIGSGPLQVLFWSQMHGDEATGTLAFLDLFNFFSTAVNEQGPGLDILEACTLHFVPMLNPDGADSFERRNAQGIDINRDFLSRQSPEAKLLIGLQEEIKPDYGFNMHDQNNLWSVSGTKMPASISLLAPPADEQAKVSPCRKKAMLLICAITEMLHLKIPGQIGRWPEEFEPRAFGDNFQRLGTATILVEAGGHKNDSERQYVRQLNYEILLEGLQQLANGDFMSQPIENYDAIPQNAKEIFHLLIRNYALDTAAGKIKLDIGINYEELIDLPTGRPTRIYRIEDLGDLSAFSAYEILEADGNIFSSNAEDGTLITIDAQNLKIAAVVSSP